MSEQESRYTQTEGSLDELAKGLANGTLSRRKALRLLGGALLGGVMASIPGVAWAATPEGRGRPCPKGAIKCGDTCCASPEDRCCRGVCTNVVFDRSNCDRCGNECAPEEGCCGGRCVPLNTAENCGGCFAGCHEAEICVSGTCQCPQAGETLCANVCCPEGHCVIDETGSFTCTMAS
jgi:hypothetical protein